MDPPERESILGALRGVFVRRSDTLRLETPRLTLRPPRSGDYAQWRALRAVSRPHLQRWEPRWPDDHLTRGAFRRRVRWAAQEIETGRAYPLLLFLRDDGALVGGLTLSNVRGAPARSGCLGYWIGIPHRRRGYMTEALERAAAFAFQDLGLTRLEAACLEENAASRAVLLRCGFRREGLVRGYLEVDGRLRDHILHGRLNTDGPCA